MTSEQLRDSLNQIKSIAEAATSLPTCLCDSDDQYCDTWKKMQRAKLRSTKNRLRAIKIITELIAEREEHRRTRQLLNESVADRVHTYEFACKLLAEVYDARCDNPLPKTTPIGVIQQVFDYLSERNASWDSYCDKLEARNVELRKELDTLRKQYDMVYDECKKSLIAIDGIRAAVRTINGLESMP